MRALFFAVLLPLFACATAPRETAGEKLYFAIELREQGHLVGKPKLLGEAGKPLAAERRQPGSSMPDYRLALVPTPHGDVYRIVLDVALPGTQGRREFELLQGEEKRLELGATPGALEVTFLLMKVDSAEFRALMKLGQPARGTRAI